MYHLNFYSVKHVSGFRPCQFSGDATRACVFLNDEHVDSSTNNLRSVESYVLDNGANAVSRVTYLLDYYDWPIIAYGRRNRATVCEIVCLVWCHQPADALMKISKVTNCLVRKQIEV